MLRREPLRRRDSGRRAEVPAARRSMARRRAAAAMRCFVWLVKQEEVN